jgi:hypothetical protein
MERQKTVNRFVLSALTVAMSGCGDDVGEVRVFFEPEETVFGIEAGNEEENIIDGWNVEYEKFLVNVGNIRATSNEVDEVLSDPNFFVVDLINGVPAGGLVLTEFKDVPAVRFDNFSYDIVSANANSQAGGDTDQADLDIMVNEGLAWFIKGKLVEAVAGTGLSCEPGNRNADGTPIDAGACLAVAEVPFEFKIVNNANWSQCEDGTGTGTLGFAVTAGATVDVKPTQHGDHWFFNNVPIGIEETDRRAQQYADAAFAQLDAGVVPNVTLDVLDAIDSATLFPANLYDLSGVIDGFSADTGKNFVVIQSMTSGHLNGEGECVPDFAQ